MVKPSPHRFKIGDLVRVVAIPPDLHDAAGIGTPEVFAGAVGKTFRVEGLGEYGHLELVVSRRTAAEGSFDSDTIWIEPEFVEAVDDATQTI
jgi:hypothetical protein